MEPLVEPLPDCSIHHLVIKTVFLVAIVSAQSQQALGSHGRTTFGHTEKVVLRPHPKFKTTSETDFHLNLASLLPEATLHTQREETAYPDLSRALLYYLNRTKPFQ